MDDPEPMDREPMDGVPPKAIADGICLTDQPPACPAAPAAIAPAGETARGRCRFATGLRQWSRRSRTNGPVGRRTG
ncbi:protein of unknown function [Azospirillum lipoferum 4B]|uniref:Uncharacterized protein n=1 Tax=Azospirillum lipoferum (strain 4B) TaxID=862719 RepID=G7Z4D3_AZOL4|nr:protein of unknown function [Azospirillum lipoferum 4B]